MKRAGHEDIRFFLGTEVEHTPALGLKTLFVVGVQPIVDIIQILSDPYTHVNQPIEHIYFGANQSFPNPAMDDFAEWEQWSEMIKPCLDTGILCTLDVDVSAAEGLTESGLTEYPNFIAMISVKLPYMGQLGYNATIKLDDRDFALSNPGVWCHSLHELQNRAVFTPWSKYTKDEVLK